MKPTVEQLHNADRYELIDSFRIDEMAQFLTRELGMAKKEPNQKSTPNKWIGWVFLLGLAAGGGVVGYVLGSGLTGVIKDSGVTQAGGISMAKQVGLAFLSFIVLLPIHEVIHAAVFKYYGATTVGFGGSWKSMIVYAYAHKFVHSGRELAWVAVMPFLVITTTLALAWVIWPQYGLFFGTTLFIHTTACVGDFVLINYQFKNRHRRIYTYDDLKEEQRSYFFAEKAG